MSRARCRGQNEVQAAGESVRNDMRVAEKPGEDSWAWMKKGRAQWLELEPGSFDFGEFRLDPEEAKITALRIDPGPLRFSAWLKLAHGRQDQDSRSMGRDIDLAAAINASMYLPDGSTSTGYMRHGEHVNNPRIAGRFGAFLWPGQNGWGLPRAAIIDRDMPDWRKILEDYDLVVQNYRMINSKGAFSGRPAARSIPFRPWPRTARAEYFFCTAEALWKPIHLPSSFCTFRRTCGQ